MKNLYRYEIRYTSDDGDTKVYLREFPVLRETEHTYYIHTYVLGIPYKNEWNKRVRKNAMNTYAFDIKEKAKEHFIRRTETRIKWFEFWRDECKRALELIKELPTL